MHVMKRPDKFVSITQYRQECVFSNKEMRKAGLFVTLGLLWTAAGCKSSSCPLDWRGDTICDLSCMTVTCGFDSQSGQMSNSDCLEACVASGCSSTYSLGNTVCDALCNVEACGWDGGDCGMCAQGCFASLLGNNVCDLACDVESCQWDQGDCVSVT